MENMYLKGNLGPREWCTEPINIRSYFDKVEDEVSYLCTGPRGKLSDTDILFRLVPTARKLTNEQIAELHVRSNPAFLTTYDLDDLKDLGKPKPSELASTSSAMDDLKMLKNVCEDSKKKRKNNNRMKLFETKLNLKEIPLKLGDDKCGYKDLTALKHIVVVFRVHEPFMQDNKVRDTNRPGRSTQEIAVLGHQTLADLRDKIVCELDYQDVIGDSSNHPNRVSTIRAGEIYPSGMFYFENTFYIDTRLPLNEDYSKPIKQWGRTVGIRFGETKAMQDMQVRDLEVRLGYPYVYTHQGCCEHLVIISDVRLLHENDCRHSHDYPLICKLSQNNMIYCMLCTINTARWIVRDCDRLAHDPTYECQNCFKKFHYVDDQKVGQFRAFHFWQRGTLL